MHCSIGNQFRNPLVLKSHQRVHRAMGVAPCDRESMQESESKPLGLNSQQKTCTAMGAVPFDKESKQESENRLYDSSIQAEIALAINVVIHRLSIVGRPDIALPGPGPRIAAEGAQSDGSSTRCIVR